MSVLVLVGHPFALEVSITDALIHMCSPNTFLGFRSDLTILSFGSTIPNMIDAAATRHLRIRDGNGHPISDYLRKIPLLWLFWNKGNFRFFYVFPVKMNLFL